MKKVFYLKVDKIESLKGNIINLYFKKPEYFLYNSGDCIDIMLSDWSLGKKTFSFASSPLDPELFITYKRGISPYKLLMQSLKVGDEIECTHYGSNFVYHPGKKSIFIAGGVGVTPFRSMIRTSLLKKVKEKMVLIYLNNSEDFAFQKELEDWSKKNNNLQNYFINSTVKGRISKKMLIELLPEILKEKFDYYISGPPLMVDSTSELIESLGLSEHIIHTDSFDGYTKELE